MSDEATAIHGVSQEGDHLVGIGNLRVLIEKEGNFWFAQGLEIDYVAQGDTMEAVQKEFKDRLLGTIHENLKMHGTIEHMLRVAPQKIWNKVLAHHYRFTQLSVHQIPSAPEFPFKEIGYLLAEGDSSA